MKSPRTISWLVAALAVAGTVAALPAGAQSPSPTPSATPTAAASPSPSPSGARSPDPAATPTPDPTPSATPTPTPSADPAPAGVQVTVTSPVVVGQVGDIVGYSIHVEVTEATDELVVTATIAPELDIVAVPLADEVTDMTSARRGSDEEISWRTGALAPGDELDLAWSGRVVAAGDLAAVTAVRATTDRDTSVTRTTTFLAAAAPVEAQGIAPRVAGKVEIRTVPVVRAADPGGSVLPVTGWSPTGALWASLALMVAGAALLVAAARRPRPRHVAALVLLLGLAACTASAPDPGALDPPERGNATDNDDGTGAAGSDGTDGTDGTDGDRRTPRDRVKGKIIYRDPGTGATTASEEGEPTTGPTTGPTGEPAGEVVFRRVVVGTRPGPPPLVQPARDGDNLISFEWDEPARKVTEATSGVLFTADQPSTLTSSLSWDDDGLVSVVTLTNTSKRRLKVQGTIVLEVSQEGRVVATLTSEPIDVVLARRGTIRAHYRYLLPSGESVVSSEFDN